MKILLLGKDGQVGFELQRSLLPLGDVIACGRNEADFCNIPQLQALIAQHMPDVIVNAAAYTAVDKAETEAALAQQINTTAVAALAAAAKRHDAWLVHYSTDYVFNGSKDGAYVETDAAAPLCVYGETKQAGEAAIMASGCKHLIFRTSWVYGLHGQNFPKKILELAKQRDTLRIVDDQIGAPTNAALIANVTTTVLRNVQPAQSGLYHLTATGSTSWFGFAVLLAYEAKENGMALKCATNQISPIPSAQFPAPAKRPLNSRLDTSKLQKTFGIALPAWQDDASAFVKELCERNLL